MNILANSGARRLLSLCLCLGVLAPAAVMAAERRPLTLGWIERARIYPGGILLDAKLDTGARTSSLHCICSQPFTRNGEQWLRFSVRSVDNKVIQLERKIERTAVIVRHFGRSEKRPVVKLGLCLGDRYREVEFTVVDRSGLEYPLLVGRNFMRRENVLVDPGRKHLGEPDCPGARPR